MEQLELYKSIDVMKCKLVKETEVTYSPIRYIENAAELFRDFGLADNADEVFAMVCLSANLSPVGIHEVSHGTPTSSHASPSDVFKRALLNNAHGIIVAHNHPSGDLTPSAQDNAVTKKLVQAGKLMEIPVVDHLIITRDGYYSYAENGQI